MQCLLNCLISLIAHMPHRQKRTREEREMDIHRWMNKVITVFDHTNQTMTKKGKIPVLMACHYRRLLNPQNRVPCCISRQNVGQWGIGQGSNRAPLGTYQTADLFKGIKKSAVWVYFYKLVHWFIIRKCYGLQPVHKTYYKQDNSSWVFLCTFDLETKLSRTKQQTTVHKDLPCFCLFRGFRSIPIKSGDKSLASTTSSCEAIWL